MRIDIEIAAHFRQQVVADFFLPILEGGEFLAEVQAAMAAFSLVGDKLTGDLFAPRQLLYSPLDIPPPSRLHPRTDMSGLQAEHRLVMGTLSDRAAGGRLAPAPWESRKPKQPIASGRR